MDFSYSDEQRLLMDSADRMGLDTWPASDWRRLVDDETALARTWATMAELGWLMLPIAEARGGLGGDAVDVMALMEAFGRNLLPGPYVASCVLATALLARGADARCAELLAATGAGTARAAAALMESGGSYDLSHVETRARREGGAWRLTGAKSHVEDGADADAFVVSARSSAGQGDGRGIGLFLVDREASGVTVERFRATDGHRHARIRLEGAPATAVGEPEGAFDDIEAAVDRALAAHLAEAVGSMEAANAATLEHLRTRRQFGVPIGSFQVLRHRAVDMAIAAEEARSMSYLATFSLDKTVAERRRAVSAAKTRVGQLGLHVGREAVQLHGGMGTSEEAAVSHHFRRQMMLDLAYGDHRHHRRRFMAAG